MHGTKPTIAQALNTAQGTHIIVRDFRGQQLVLTDYDGRNGFRWSQRGGKGVEPARYPQCVALVIADKAAREYGAKCATLAADGSMVEPAAARAVDSKKISTALQTMCALLNKGYLDSAADACVEASRVHGLTQSESDTLLRTYYAH